MAGLLQHLAKPIRLLRTDLEEDQYLRYILLLSFVVGIFWLWYRTPNFVAPDEYGRLLRPMKAGGYFVADPGFNSFRRGVTDGSPPGASLYLYGLTAIPAVLLVVLTGQFGEFTALASIQSRWTLWHTVPDWYWTVSILSARLINVLFGVIAVYLMYRLGTVIHNRLTGRFAGILLSLSLAFIASLHEANEDTAMLLFMLVTLYYSILYVESGTDRHFLIGCVFGGVAIAFKLTGGTVVFFLLGAVLLRLVTADETFESLATVRLLTTGGVIGLLVVVVGTPDLLLSGPSELFRYLFTQASIKSSPSLMLPFPGYLLLYSYLNAVGLPLFIGLLVAIPLAAFRIWNKRPEWHLESIVFVGVIVYLGVFSQWAQITTHHTLPSIPLLVLLLAIPLAKLYQSDRQGTRLIVAVLVISTAIYSGIGLLSYTADPRDEATAWMRSNVAEDERMVVYQNSVADIAVIHGRPVTHYDFVEKVGVSGNVVNDSNFTEWMIETPRRQPAYIQLTAREIRYTNTRTTLPERYPARAKYINRLLDQDHFNYTIVKEWGVRTRDRTPTERLLWAGLTPKVEKLEEYVVILKHDKPDT